jgi:signal transduction histidine kinase
MLATLEPHDLEAVTRAEWLPDQLLLGGKQSLSGHLHFQKNNDQQEPGRAAIHPDPVQDFMDALLDNAMKYCEPGTPVTVRVGHDPEGAWVEVADRGCGVTAAELPQVFRPFFRSEAARKRGVPGAGLGLAVAVRIATAMGGSIGVASEPGHGSQFRVRLPGTSLEGASSQCPAKIA